MKYADSTCNHRFLPCIDCRGKKVINCSIISLQVLPSHCLIYISRKSTTESRSLWKTLLLLRDYKETSRHTFENLVYSRIGRKILSSCVLVRAKELIIIFSYRNPVSQVSSRSDIDSIQSKSHSLHIRQKWAYHQSVELEIAVAIRWRKQPPLD